MNYYRTIDNDIYIKTNVELIEAVIIDEEEYISCITRWEQTNDQNISYFIEILKKKLQDTDYQAIKYFEGEMTEEEYLPIKEKRRQYRYEINELQKELNKMI